MSIALYRCDLKCRGNKAFLKKERKHFCSIPQAIWLLLHEVKAIVAPRCHVLPEPFISTVRDDRLHLTDKRTKWCTAIMDAALWDGDCEIDQLFSCLQKLLMQYACAQSALVCHHFCVETACLQTRMFECQHGWCYSAGALCIMHSGRASSLNSSQCMYVYFGAKICLMYITSSRERLCRANDSAHMAERSRHSRRSGHSSSRSYSHTGTAGCCNHKAPPAGKGVSILNL